MYGTGYGSSNTKSIPVYFYFHTIELAKIIKRNKDANIVFLAIETIESILYRQTALAVGRYKPKRRMPPEIARVELNLQLKLHE